METRSFGKDHHTKVNQPTCSMVNKKSLLLNYALIISIGVGNDMTLAFLHIAKYSLNDQPNHDDSI